MRFRFFSLKSRPLRVDILTALVGLLVLSVVTIILYSYYSNTKATLSLSKELMARVEEMVASKVTSFLEPAERISTLMSHVAFTTGYSLPENDTLELFAIQSIEDFPHLSMVSMADEKGNFLMPKRMPDGTIATKSINRNSAQPIVMWKYRDLSGNVVGIRKSGEIDYDPRVRPWYEGAKQKMGTYWTDVYVLFTDQVPGITVAQPVIGKEGALLGVLGLDIRLGEMSAFLKSLKIGKTGFAFIFNHKGEVVAFPEASRIVRYDDESVRLARIEEVGLSWISDFCYKGGRSLNECLLESEGKRYLGKVIPFPESFAKSWKIAIVVPEDDFVGPIKTTNLISLILSLGILFVAILAAITVSRRISRPILMLAEEAQRIRAFELDGELELNSPIKEIQIMQEGMTRMKASLRSFARFAPQELVREVVARGKEAILGGQKRDVTLLFCDLRGFTQFSEKTEPEEVVSRLNVHFDTMVNIITSHRGFVCDFLGDGLFAVFGAPTLDRDHANHAVVCSVEMQLARNRLNDQCMEVGLAPMEMGIGLNTGLCVVGNMGSDMRIKYGVVGHAVNLASRIESFAVGGQVLVSEATRNAVSASFRFAGPFTVWPKGVEGAVTLWEVRGVQGKSSLELPPTVPGLTVLSNPIHVLLRQIRGKSLDSERFPAKIVGLSPSGAKIECGFEMDCFAAVQITFTSSSGTELTIDSNVVGPDDDGGHRIVRFGGLDPSVAKVISEILKSESDS